jgi:putative two-component system response regulator
MFAQALLVDDSRSALDFLKRLIEGDGLAQATAFQTPLQGLTAARNHDFDIVLVDYEMPGMDGISFIRRIREMPKFADIPVVMITSIQTDDVRLEALEAGATDFLPKSPQGLEFSVRLRNLVNLGMASRKLNNRAADLAKEVAAATHKLQQREEEIILRLALAVEYRDNDTGEHTLRVAKYSRLIAEQLDQSDRFCRNIYLAAPLHDVGKVAIPDQILLKPGRLDPYEIAVMRTHASIGGEILANSRSELIQLAALIACAHHERWNGTGYPSGLAREDIPLCARIVMVADVFDALTMKRPYKEAMPIAEARDYLERQKGQEFDPSCVDAFLARWNEVTTICASKERSTVLVETTATLVPEMLETDASYNEIVTQPF